MRKTTDSRWVHVICAMFLPDAQFISQNSGENVVDISRVNIHHEVTESLFSTIMVCVCFSVRTHAHVHAFKKNV